MNNKIKKACTKIRKVPFNMKAAIEILGAPSEIVKAERVLIDRFEYEINRQFTSVDVVAIGDTYELWVNEVRIYNHLCLHKVYKRALIELERINERGNYQ